MDWNIVDRFDRVDLKDFLDYLKVYVSKDVYIYTRDELAFKGIFKPAEFCDVVGDMVVESICDDLGEERFKKFFIKHLNCFEVIFDIYGEYNFGGVLSESNPYNIMTVMDYLDYFISELLLRCNFTIDKHMEISKYVLEFSEYGVDDIGDLICNLSEIELEKGSEEAFTKGLVSLCFDLG